jgi:hypothetical protein
VDEYIDPPQRVASAVQECLQCRRIGDVAGVRVHLDPLLPKIRLGRLQRTFLSRTDGHIRPFSREGQGDGSSDAAASTEDCTVPPFESKIQVDLPDGVRTERTVSPLATERDVAPILVNRPQAGGEE